MEYVTEPIETVTKLHYTDSHGDHAIAVEPGMLVKENDYYVTFMYSKTLAHGSPAEGNAYLCLPKGLALKNMPSPADTEEEAECQLLTALSREISEHEHVLEQLKKTKKAVAEELL